MENLSINQLDVNPFGVVFMSAIFATRDLTRAIGSRHLRCHFDLKKI